MNPVWFRLYNPQSYLIFTLKRVKKNKT